MDVFRGNMSDSDTLKENLDGFKKEYGMTPATYRNRHNAEMLPKTAVPTEAIH